LALLSQGLLTGKDLTAFVKRSVELIWWPLGFPKSRRSCFLRNLKPSKIALHPLQIVGDFLFVLWNVEFRRATWYYLFKNQRIDFKLFHFNKKCKKMNWIIISNDFITLIYEFLFANMMGNK
jgi:hypothetical protein